MVRKFCCCGTNLKATKILSILFIVGRIISVAIAGGAVFLVYNFCDNTCDAHNPDCENDVNDTCDVVKLIVIAIASFLGVLLLLDIGLLVGSIKKKVWLLWAWLIGALLSIIVLISLLVTISINFGDLIEEADTINGEPPTDESIKAVKTYVTIITIAPAIVYSLISVWIMAAVYQATKEIKELKG